MTLMHASSVVDNTTKSYMKKKRLYSQLKNVAIVSLSIATASILYFQPWKKKINVPKEYSPWREISQTTPEISEDEGTLIQHNIDKSSVYCEISYNITPSTPLFIKRYYPERKEKNQKEDTEYLVLRPLRISNDDDVIDLYKLMETAKNEDKKEPDKENQHMRYEPQVLEAHKTTYKTRKRIKNQYFLNTNQKGYLTCGIFYRQGNTERIVGSITISPEDEINGTPCNFYCSYFTGHPKDIQVKGITRISLEAAINHLIHTGVIKEKIKTTIKGKTKLIDNKIVLIIYEKNIKSINIAEKLGFRQYKAIDRYPKNKEWVYPCPIEGTYFYEISVTKWIQENREAHKVNKRKAPVE